LLNNFFLNKTSGIIVYLFILLEPTMEKTATSSKLLQFFCMICIGILCNTSIFAQKSDSISYFSRSKHPSKASVIKPNLPTYRPLFDGFSFIPYNNLLSSKAAAAKSDKNLTFIKVSPSTVDDQITVVYKLERESNISIKIMDLLGNEVTTLSNERSASGEQAKTFSIANRLSSGIYFVRIVAGAETSVKRISVL
jgi:hypothetical protein